MYKYQLQKIYQIDELSDLVLLMLLAIIATQSLTYLLRESKLFSFLRFRYSPVAIVLNCGYCTSYHVSFFLLSPLFREFKFDYFNTVAFLVCWLVVQRLSNVFHDITKLLYFGRVSFLNVTINKENMNG